MITKKVNGGKMRKAAHASPLLYKAMDVCRPALSFLAETLRSGRLGSLDRHRTDIEIKPGPWLAKMMPPVLGLFLQRLTNCN